MDYATYHLLGEPETTIDKMEGFHGHLIFGYFVFWETSLFHTPEKSHTGLIFRVLGYLHFYPFLGTNEMFGEAGYPPEPSRVFLRIGLWEPSEP